VELMVLKVDRPKEREEVVMDLLRIRMELLVPVRGVLWNIVKLKRKRTGS
jgi:hypothetical protein